MRATGERYIPIVMSGRIEVEHLQRYKVAKDLCHGKVVLDIASGEGYGSAILCDTASKVIGIDVDEEAVTHARLNYSHYENRLTFEAGSALDIPLNNSSIDFIVSFETIEHCNDPSKLVEECARVLNEDGILVISSPNKEVYSSKSDYQNPYHLNEMTFEEFRSILEKNFALVEIYGQSIVSASYIRSIDSIENAVIHASAGSGSTIVPASEAEFKATYFLAVCGNGKSKLPLINHELFFHQKFDEINLQDQEISQLKSLARAEAFAENPIIYNANIPDILEGKNMIYEPHADIFFGSVENLYGDHCTAWAVHKGTGCPADSVMISDGLQTIVVKPHYARPDVASSLKLISSWMSGCIIPSDFIQEIRNNNLEAIAVYKGQAGRINIIS